MMHPNPKHNPQPTLDRRSNSRYVDDTVKVKNVAANDAIASNSPENLATGQNQQESDSRATANLSSADLAQLAGSSVDELMDEVFEDVDYMLDKGVSVAPQKFDAASTALSLPNTDEHSSNAIASDTTATNTDDGDAATAAAVTSTAGESQSWYETIGLAFPILGACATLGVALAAGLILYGPNSNFRSGAEVASSATTSNSADGQFATYMERAIETIITTDAAGDHSGTSVSNNGGIGSDDLDNQRRFADVPDRVYIPVYQPPQSALTPSVPLNPSVGTPSSNELPLPTFPVSPSAEVATPPLTTNPAPIPPQTANSSDFTYEHVLVGLLQMTSSEESVAMFDYADGTHRVKVGEQIGSSGWSLVSVSESEALIRRNGDVRSIYIGQSF